MREHASIPHPAKPVVPCDVSTMDQDRLVVAVVPYVFEEDATAQKRYLEGLDVDVGMVCAPGVGSDSI